MVDGPGRHRILAEATKKVFELLDQAAELRPDVVAAMRATIEGPAGTGRATAPQERA